VRPVSGVCHLGQGGARFTRGNLITPWACRSQGRVDVAGERCLPLKGLLCNRGKGLIDAKTGLKQAMASSKGGVFRPLGLANRERATIGRALMPRNERHWHTDDEVDRGLLRI
jgi:hypothetical protein